MCDPCPADDPEPDLATPEQMGALVGVMAMSLDDLDGCGGP